MGGIGETVEKGYPNLSMWPIYYLIGLGTWDLDSIRKLEIGNQTDCTDSLISYAIIIKHCMIISEVNLATVQV